MGFIFIGARVFEILHEYVNNEINNEGPFYV